MTTSIIRAGGTGVPGVQTTGGDDGALALKVGPLAATVEALNISSTGTGAFVGQVTATGFTGTLDGILGSGTPAAATVTTLNGVTPATAQFTGGGNAAGQCYLSFISTTSLKLTPKDGDKIIINGVEQTIPSAGTSVANTGLSAATIYYVYAYMVSTTLTLEVVATVPTAHSDGIQIKTGDASRTLVGMAYTAAGTPGTFGDSFTASYFNRKNKSFSGVFTANRTTTSTSFVVVNSEITVNFVTWADDQVQAIISGNQSNGTANVANGTTIGWDDTADADFLNVSQSATGLIYPIGVTGVKSLSVGKHSATLMGATYTSGTATWLVMPVPNVLYTSPTVTVQFKG